MPYPHPNQKKRTYRDSPLTVIVTFHLKFLVFLERSIEEDNDIHLGCLKSLYE